MATFLEKYVAYCRINRNPKLVAKKQKQHKAVVKECEKLVKLFKKGDLDGFTIRSKNKGYFTFDYLVSPDMDVDALINMLNSRIGPGPQSGKDCIGFIMHGCLTQYGGENQVSLTIKLQICPSETGSKSKFYKNYIKYAEAWLELPESQEPPGLSGVYEFKASYKKVYNNLRYTQQRGIYLNNTNNIFKLDVDANTNDLANYHIGYCEEMDNHNYHNYSYLCLIHDTANPYFMNYVYYFMDRESIKNNLFYNMILCSMDKFPDALKDLKHKYDYVTDYIEYIIEDLWKFANDEVCEFDGERINIPLFMSDYFVYFEIRMNLRLEQEFNFTMEHYNVYYSTDLMQAGYLKPSEIGSRGKFYYKFKRIQMQNDALLEEVLGEIMNQLDIPNHEFCNLCPLERFKLEEYPSFELTTQKLSGRPHQTAYLIETLKKLYEIDVEHSDWNGIVDLYFNPKIHPKIMHLEIHDKVHDVH
jgi:hypothetical protein